MKNVLFLASGRGSAFQSFVDHSRLGVLQGISIRGLICNRPGAEVVQRARSAGIPVFEIQGVAGRKFESKEKRDEARLAFDTECVSRAKSLDTEHIVLAGFDQIFTRTLVDNFPNRILNTHPAYDLKKFGGRNMVGSRVHEAVLASRVAHSGCAVHFVTKDVDQGPVILKKRVDVFPDDTPEKLESRVLRQEHLLYPEALQLVVDSRVIVPSTGDRCYVDMYSNNWDVEWANRQESYLNYIAKP